MIEALEMWPAFVLLAGLCTLAVAVHLATPSSTSRLSRSLPALGVAALLGVGELLLRRFDAPLVVLWLHLVFNLVVAFSSVHIAVALVELALRKMGIEAAPIVVELVLAAGWLVAVAVVLTASGFDLTGIAAASTLAVAILTISLQATLGNVVGGMAIQFDRSIAPGDWLLLDDRREGVVRQVRWRHTTLETRDGNLILVPNATLLSMTVTVIGRPSGAPGPYRMEIPFTTPLTTPPERIIAAVEAALRSSPLPNTSEHPLPDCLCADLGSEGNGQLTFRARFWVEDPLIDQLTASTVRRRIHAAVRREGLSFGIPVATLSHDPSRTDNEAEQRISARALLERVPLFDCLTAAEKDQLAPKLRCAPYCGGEVITREGDEADWLYLLSSGKAEVSRGGQFINDLVAPNLFGELGLMTGASRSATVVAAGDVTCYRLDKHHFDEILRGRPGIDMALSEILASRRTETTAAPVTPRDESPDHQWWLSRIRTFFRL